MVEEKLEEPFNGLKDKNMEKLNHKDLLKAGVHFGHLTRKWNPKMSKYIFMEKNGIHIIDLYKTIDCAFTVASLLKNIAKSGRKIMFVATKKQAKTFVFEKAKKLNMPYVTERWLGGMLTNFSTIRKSLKKLSAIESKESQDTYKTDFSKKERLMISRNKYKLERVLGGISTLNRIPAALFVVDIKHEEIAINEARKLVCAQARPEECEEIYRWLYDNLEIITKDSDLQDKAVLIIKQGLVDHSFVADPEINLASVMIKLARLHNGN